MSLENLLEVADEFRQFKLNTLCDPDLHCCARYKLEIPFITGIPVNIDSGAEILFHETQLWCYFEGNV
jgi:hypothetical protein